jgi:hypothetical protein
LWGCVGSIGSDEAEGGWEEHKDFCRLVGYCILYVRRLRGSNVFVRNSLYHYDLEGKGCLPIIGCETEAIHKI